MERGSIFPDVLPLKKGMRPNYPVASPAVAGSTSHAVHHCIAVQPALPVPGLTARGNLWGIVVMVPHRDRVHGAALPKTPGPGLSARCLRIGGEKSRVMLYLMRNVIISQEASHANHHHH